MAHKRVTYAMMHQCIMAYLTEHVRIIIIDTTQSQSFSMLTMCVCVCEKNSIAILHAFVVLNRIGLD